MRIKTALILCAGFGQRLRPLTIVKPKPLLEINGITLLENTVNLLRSLNFSHIKINSYLSCLFISINILHTLSMKTCQIRKKF